VAELESQVEAERNQYLRTLADFQNFRRRNEEQRGELAQFANRELILGMLPVLDNFERALAAADKNQSYEALVGGVALTLRQLQEFLKKNGVEAIEAKGKEFDPNLHEAVMRDEGSDQPENTVVEELQKGYTMHSKVLRPSMVKVARSA
jgi:molecular chaperone GrpE